MSLNNEKVLKKIFRKIESFSGFDNLRFEKIEVFSNGMQNLIFIGIYIHSTKV